MNDPDTLNLDRLRRLSDFWNWLPAYRAVAETEHVRTAAERLRVSPSALSRSIGLLEESIGEKLFDREGRGIKLNRAGREFLNHLRVAMRVIDDALQAVESSTFAGTLHLSAPDDLMGLLWTGLRDLRETHPALVVRLHNTSSREINPSLARGALDLAFEQDPQPEEGLVIERFMESPNAVFCGTNHPLYGHVDATAEEVLAHGFVAGVDKDHLVVDGWPPELPRKIVATVPRLQAGVEACAFGGLLAALPVHVAAPYCERDLLWRLPQIELEPSTFFVIHRESINGRDRNAEIAKHLRDQLMVPRT